MSWVAFVVVAWLLASVPISLVLGAAIAAGLGPATPVTVTSSPARVVPFVRSTTGPAPA